MSVVNKMLQDLENRSDQSDIDSAEYVAPKSVSSRRATWMIIFIGIAIGIFVIDRVIGINQAVNKSLTMASELIHGKKQTENTTAKTTIEDQKRRLEMQKSSKEANIKPAEDTTNNASPVSNSGETSPSEDDVNQQTTQAVASTTRELAQKEALSEIDPDIQSRDPKAFAATFDALANSPAETAEKVPLNATPEELQALQNNVPEPTSKGEMRVSRVGDISLDEKLQQMVDEATLAINDKQPVLAINILDRALEFAPERQDIRKRLAVLLFANQQESLAESVLQDGVRLSPERVDLRLMLGRILHRQKKMQSLYDALAPLTPDVNIHSEYLALQAAAAQQLNKFDEASQLFSVLVDFDSSRANWWLGLAISEDRQARTKTALEAYRKVLELRQVSPAVLRFVEDRIGALES